MTPEPAELPIAVGHTIKGTNQGAKLKARQHSFQIQNPTSHSTDASIALLSFDRENIYFDICALDQFRCQVRALEEG
jgi:hypothetical protein